MESRELLSAVTLAGTLKAQPSVATMFSRNPSVVSGPLVNNTNFFHPTITSHVTNINSTHVQTSIAPVVTAITGGSSVLSTGARGRSRCQRRGR